MTDIYSKKKRSEIMSHVKGKNTGLELLAKKLLKDSGVSGFKRGDGVFGRPDFIFTKEKIALFIDGGFWHGLNYAKIKNKLPSFWKEKMAANMKRDRRVNKTLRSEGWKVLRVWDYQIKKDPQKFIKRLKQLLEGQKA